MSRFSMLLLALVGCTNPIEQSKHQALEQAAVPLGPVGYYTPNSPSAGRAFELVSLGGPSNARTALFWSDGVLGAGPCPAFLGGECLDITAGSTGLRWVLLPNTDAAGDLVAPLQLPRGVRPGTYVMQVVSMRGGTIEGTPPFAAEILPYAADCANPGANEPNDSAAQATVLGGGSSSSGSVCEQDNFDWYAVDLVAGRTTIIDVLFSHAEGDIDVVVTRSPMSNHETLLADVAVASSASSNDNEFLLFNPMVSGTYYIGILLFSDTGPVVGNSYDLSVVPL